MPRLALALVLAVPWMAGAASAQDSRDAERKLERIRGELKDVAGERRKIEGQRGDATRKLREADELVGKSSRELDGIEARLARQRAALADLRLRREGLQQRLAAQRSELAQLLRAAYRVGSDAPLKVLLSQDRVADAERTLAYHGYLQRDRARRIAELSGQLQELDAVERQIVAEQARLDAMRREQHAQLAQVERDRQARKRLVAQLDRRYKDRKAREHALGRDAKALERLLAQLRAAAARAARERAAAAERARRSGEPPAKPAIASAAPIRVGGLSWPLSGTLLAGYGGRLPDGRSSSGVLVGASVGTPVRAVADGQVVFADWMNGYGLILIIDHGNGYMSLYANNDALLRDAGDAVKRGDPVARVGNSGGQGPSALYFELRHDGQPVNPSSWLQKR